MSSHGSFKLHLSRGIIFLTRLQKNSMTGPLPSPTEGPSTKAESWSAMVDPEVLKSLPESEKNRQE
jgi:hypothetical protein